MQLDPTRRGRDGLPPIRRSPALHEAHPDGAHTSQLVYRLEALGYRLRQQRRELLVIEDLQVATGWYLADGGRMPTVTLIAIWALHEYARIGQALCEHLSTDVVKSGPFADMPSRLLDHGVPIHVRQQAQAETLGVAWIGESVHRDARLGCMEGLAYSRIQLVVTYRTPKSRLAIHNRLCVDRTGRQTVQRHIIIVIHIIAILAYVSRRRCVR